MFHIPTSSPKITRKFGLSEAFADEAMARNSHYTSDANRMGGARMIPSVKLGVTRGEGPP